MGREGERGESGGVRGERESVGGRGRVGEVCEE